MLSKPLWRITPDLETTRDRPASRERPGEGDETEQLRRLIGAAVAAVLKVPTVSTHANFIDLGVTSLSLVTLHARLKRNSAPTSRSAG
ncbi:hypothetical protein ALI144C_07080 [Actinosynnema sp. ALI-1.44]|nr:hypothetical protein ALI144C_07080 [Actinosynnema sp. ALI-1.44]